MEKILIFELNWLGDILFSLPFIRALRKKFPNSYIACVVVPRYIDLLVNNPWVNYLHAFSDDNSVFSVWDKLAFIKMIRKEKYDTCFFLKPSRTKNIMAEFAGIHERIGFSGKGGFLTNAVDLPKGEVHRADILLSLASAVGVGEADGTYEYFLSREDGEKADGLLHEKGAGENRIVAFNPGGNWEPKRWPKEKFIGLGKKLLLLYPDIEIILTGAGKDIDLCEEISSEINNPRCFILAGETTLNELAAIYKKCELVISADSGPLHLASSVGATTIGIFGPTSARITGQRGRGENIVIAKEISCKVPCYIDSCSRDYYCMKEVEIGDVMDAVQKVL